MRFCGLSTITVLIMHFNGENLFPSLRPAFNNMVAMDTAPGRYIVQRTGIGAGNSQLIAWLQARDSILGSDDRHRAEQVRGIKLVVRHAMPVEFRMLAGVRRPLPERSRHQVFEC